MKKAIGVLLWTIIVLRYAGPLYHYWFIAKITEEAERIDKRTAEDVQWANEHGVEQ